jgi:hypothetical protein
MQRYPTSTAGKTAVVVVSLFVHGDAVEQMVGDPGIGGASASVTPQIVFGVQLGTTGWLSSRAPCADAFVRKLNVLASMATMHASVVTHLRGSLWVSVPRYGSG